MVSEMELGWHPGGWSSIEVGAATKALPLALAMGHRANPPWQNVKSCVPFPLDAYGEILADL